MAITWSVLEILEATGCPLSGRISSNMSAIVCLHVIELKNFEHNNSLYGLQYCIFIIEYKEYPIQFYKI